MNGELSAADAVRCDIDAGMKGNRRLSISIDSSSRAVIDDDGFVRGSHGVAGDGDESIIHGDYLIG